MLNAERVNTVNPSGVKLENIRVVTQFCATWETTPKGRRTEEIISTFKESNRLIDTWTYYRDGNGLYMVDQETHEKVHLKDLIDTTSYLGKKETEIVDYLDDWFKESEKGLALWVAPQYPGKYPCTKVCFHQIAYNAETGEKTLLNSAVLFDSEPIEALKLVYQFFPNLEELITNLEDLRNILIIPPDNFAIEEMILAVNEIDPATKGSPRLTNEELQKRAAYISDLIEAGVNPDIVTKKMSDLELIGKHTFSCLPSLQDKPTFSETITGKFIYNCGKCKRPINKHMKKGNRCPHCGGIYKGC